MADNCSELSAQISALNSQVGRLNILTELQVRQIAQQVAESVVAPLRTEIGKKLDTSQQPAIVQQSILGAQNLILPAVGITIAQGINPLRASLTALEDLVGVINGSLAAVEAGIANALKVASNALGIGGEALSKVGALAAEILPLLNLIGTIANIVATIQLLETLGSRIDEVENGLVSLGSSVSGILGRFLGIQNRLSANETSIGQVRGIAIDAKGIGEAADLKAGAAIGAARTAQNTADTALGEAKQAQLTADGAVRNAATANANAIIAHETAIAAQKAADKGIGIGGDALNKAGIALTIASTALTLVQGIKYIRGLDGLPGIPGAPGARGATGAPGAVGAPGIPGAMGATGAAGVAGAPGRIGQRGLPGIKGRDGVDAVPYNDAGLKALIVQQNAEIKFLIVGVGAKISAALAPIFAICTQILTLVSTVSNAAQLAVLNTINSKLGTQVTGGISGLIKSVAENTYIEKALTVLTFAATVHNALMLSNNLGQTFIQIVDQVTGFILPKGLDGTPISFSSVLGKAMHEVIADTIGEANYQTMSEDWAKANRIYQAASNVFNQISNLGGLITAGLEVVAGNVGKVGNALKTWGVVGEKAYNFMNPQPNLKGKFFEYLNTSNEKLQAIAMVIAIPIGITAAAAELSSSVVELKKTLDQKDPVDEHGNPIFDEKTGLRIKYKPGLEQPAPEVTTNAALQAKADSTNIIQATLDDIFNAND
ncbi:MAG: hypothetical protein V7K50_23255 [Nostoc sp.]|uniref:hypothetical protein n=1 Tax=Nostoc sp. TaxID=1180 RepID=UPI002FF937F1